MAQPLRSNAVLPPPGRCFRAAGMSCSWLPIPRIPKPAPPFSLLLRQPASCLVCRASHGAYLYSRQHCVVRTCSPSGSKAVQTQKPSKDAAAASAKSVSSQQSAQASDYSPSLSTQQTSEVAVTNAAASSSPSKLRGDGTAASADVSSAAARAAAPTRAGSSKGPAVKGSRQQPTLAGAATASEGQGATGQIGGQSKQEQPFQVFPGMLPAPESRSHGAEHMCTIFVLLV